MSQPPSGPGCLTALSRVSQVIAAQNLLVAEPFRYGGMLTPAYLPGQIHTYFFFPITHQFYSQSYMPQILSD
jgi:hypothetical protein